MIQTKHLINSIKPQGLAMDPNSVAESQGTCLPADRLNHLVDSSARKWKRPNLFHFSRSTSPIKKVAIGVKSFLLTLPAFLLPFFVLAQSSLDSPRTPSNFKDLISMILNFISFLVPMLIGLGLLVFLWGMAKFILHAEEEDKREEGRQLMLWGIIGLFIMVSFWGILKILTGTFGFGFFFPQLKTH